MRIEREVERRLVEGLDSNTYALDSDKTKIASEYVRHMHRQRRLFEKRKNERDGRYA